MRDLYRVINEFRRGCVPGTNLLKDEEGDLMQIPTVFWISWRIICLSYGMCMEL